MIAAAAIVTVDDAALLVSACEVAVTVTVPPVGTVDGAVYIPAALIVPMLGAVAEVLETLHVTAVFVVPVTFAVNCCVCPVCTDAVGGVTVTTIVCVFVPLICPVHAPSSNASGARIVIAHLLWARAERFGAFTSRHSRTISDFGGAILEAGGWLPFRCLKN